MQNSHVHPIIANVLDAHKKANIGGATIIAEDDILRYEMALRDQQSHLYRTGELKDYEDKPYRFKPW